MTYTLTCKVKRQHIIPTKGSNTICTCKGTHIHIYCKFTKGRWTPYTGKKNFNMQALETADVTHYTCKWRGKTHAHWNTTCATTNRPILTRQTLLDQPVVISFSSVPIVNNSRGEESKNVDYSFIRKIFGLLLIGSCFIGFICVLTQHYLHH